MVSANNIHCIADSVGCGVRVGAEASAGVSCVLKHIIFIDFARSLWHYKLFRFNDLDGY
jgi:hypothetical protein